MLNSHTVCENALSLCLEASYTDGSITENCSPNLKVN